MLEKKRKRKGNLSTNTKNPYIYLHISIILLFFSSSSLVLGNNNIEYLNNMFKTGIIIVDYLGSGDFITIQEALDYATENDTIFIKNGEYLGTFHVNKPLTILGESKENVILIPFFKNSSYSFIIDSQFFSLKNITFQGFVNEEMNGNGTYCRNTAIFINNSMMNIDIDNIIFNKISSIIKMRIYNNLIRKINNITIKNSVIKSGLGLISYHNNISELIIKNNSFLGNEWEWGKQIIGYGGFYLTGLSSVKKIIVENNSFNNIKLDISMFDNTIFKNNVLQNLSDSDNSFRGGLFQNNIIINSEYNLKIFGDTYSLNSISHNKLINLSGGIIFTNDYNTKTVTIENNLIFNCSLGIEFHEAFPCKIENNKFLNSGINFRKTLWEKPSNDINIFNNTLNNEPIIFLKDKINRNKIEQFGQLIVLNSNNIEISRLNLSGGKNYSLINILSSNNIEIKDNILKMNGFFITCIRSSGCNIHNNTFNGSEGIDLEYCKGMSVYENYFTFSNKSCIDTEQNDWFRNGIGNYWKGMDLPDIDGNGISETSVKIPGGSSEDKYPLVPNVHLDLIPSQSIGTTGEIISLDVIAEPTIFNEVKSLNLYYGNKTHGFTYMRLDSEMEHQSVLIEIPTNMTGAIELFLNATDKYGLVTESIHRSIDIHDNDPPEILLVECPNQVRNGEHFGIVLKAIDNVGIGRINASVRLVDDEWTVPLVGTGNDTWTLEMDADPFIVYPYNITFEAYDTSNNYARLRNIEVRIIDTVYPELVRDLTLSEGGTGQLFGFVAEITDNDALGRVEVEYKQGVEGGTVEMEQDLNIFHADIRLSEDSVEPLTYRFVIKDLSGNTVTSDERTVTIIDVLFPEIEVGEYPGEIGTGEELSLDWNITDNIGVVNSTVLIFRDDILIGTGTGESIRFIIPVDHLGNILFRIVIKDGAGNERTFNSTPIRIIDTIFPEATLEGKLEWFEGDSIELKVLASDNIGVENIEWKCGGKEGFGDIIKLVFDEPDVYQLEVEVSDTSGNVQVFKENITVLETDEPYSQTLGLYLIVGAILLILIVIIIVLFLFFKTKSSNEGLKDEGLDSTKNIPLEQVTTQGPSTEIEVNGLEEE